jgi:hypothetical protein
MHMSIAAQRQHEKKMTKYTTTSGRGMETVRGVSECSSTVARAPHRSLRRR